MLRRAIRITIIIFASIFILTMVAMAVVVNFIFDSEKITPKVRDLAQEYIESDITIGGVDLTFFSSFPRFSIEIDSLVIKQNNPEIDDLLAAKRCVVAIRPLGLLKKRILIDEITIENTNINLYVDSLTRPENLFKFESDTTNVANDSLNLDGYTLRIDRIKIDSSTLIIDDREKNFYSKMGGFSLDTRLSLGSETSELDTKIGLDELSMRLKEKVFASNASLSLATKMRYYRDSTLLTLNRTSFTVNDIEMRVNGSLRGDREAKSVYVDIESMLSTPSVSEFFKLVPAFIFDQRDEITASGNVDMKLSVKGDYSETHYPDIFANIKIEDGEASYASRKLSVEKIYCDADMVIDLNSPEKSYTTINNFHVNTSDIMDLTLSGKVTNIIENPYVDINIDSEIDFDRLVEIFPLQEGVMLSGKNSSDLHTRLLISDIEKSNYGSMYIDGVSTFKNVAINVDGALFSQDSTATTYLDVNIEEGTLLFGDNVRTDNNSRTLLATIDVSGFGFKDKTGQYASIKNLKLTSGANFDSKTKKVNGVGIKAEAQNTIVGVEGQMEANLATTNATLTISPKNEERNTKIHALINSQSIDATETLYNSKLNLSTVDMNLNLTKVDSATWDRNGEIGFKHLRLYSDLFPIRTAITDSRVSVLNNKISLVNTHLKMGESNIVATGSITNLIKVFFFDSDAEMEGELNVSAPILNVNELIVATNKSVLMSEEVDVIESDSTLVAAITTIPADTAGMMLLIPKNINFGFDLDIKKVKYNDAYIEDIIGVATIKDGILSLDKLTLNTIGAKAFGALRYENLDLERSSLNANLNFNQVQINRIGELLPNVAAMMPMVNSIDGAVDFEIKVAMDIDQELNVDMNTLLAAASLSGKEIILRDSEDFVELADALMFKNKDQSRIESLEVYMTADKSKVEVLPFEITIDRYKAIIGGEQTIDLDKMNVIYDYNISVIKSPLPFKAGVDVFGTNEEFDFKITKAKLKNSDFNALREEYMIFKESVK